MTNATKKTIDIDLIQNNQIGLPSLGAEVMIHSQILIIDDNHTLVKGIVEMFDLFNYSCLTATKGYEGIELFRQHSEEIGAVILDYVMPDLNGEQTFYALREIDPFVKVIFTSGYMDPNVYQRLINEPFVYFLSKPFQFTNLLHLVKKGTV